jgi:hypothetical protein
VIPSGALELADKKVIRVSVVKGGGDVVVPVNMVGDLVIKRITRYYSLPSSVQSSI